MKAPALHPGPVRTGAKPAHRQRGSMAIAMMLMLLGLITILGIVEVGYLYWAHRDAQKVADLAALSGAQQLPDCTAATSAANNNATKDNSFKGTPTVSCGSWGGAASPDSVTPATSSTAATNTGVKVVAQMPLTPFFGFAKFSGTNATAVAANTGPVAAFSVGSQLLELQDSGLVPGVLKILGLDVGGTSLVGYNGLANLRITPSGLLSALCNMGSVCVDVTSIADVGTLNNILAAKQVSVGDLLNAIVNIGEQQQLGQVALDALNTLIQAQAKIPGGTLVQLGTNSTSGNRGLFAIIEAANLQSALNAQVSALDLVNVGLEVANSHHLVTLPVSIPGVSIWASIIEPPSIAIGGIGTTAYTAQIRIGINIDTNAIPLLGSALSLLGTTINLPIIIDVVDGKGTITHLCDPDSTGETATIHAEAAVLNICAGSFGTTIQSTTQSCDYNLQKTNFVTALGIPVSQGMLHVPALTGESIPDLVMHQGDIQSINANLDIGTSLNTLVTQLLNAITIGQITGLSAVLAPVVGLVLTPLTPVLNAIGENLLQPLLVQILGASPGRVDVHLMSLQCHNTQLVY